MRAIVQARFGDLDVLALEERPEPEVGPHDVRVRVHAVSLNFGDKMALLGQPILFRPAFGSRRNTVTGRDLAGVVDAVGSEVTRFAPGDRVFGEVDHGACADLAVATEDQLTKMPDTLSFGLAATLPIAGITALQGLRDAAAVKAGDKVLINGASGSVGTMALQIAKALGAHVTAVCSTRNVEQARALGADAVIDYTQQDYTEGGPRFDVIFDLVGNHTLAQRRSALNPDGTYIATFGQGGGKWVGPLGRILWAGLAGLTSDRVKVLTVTSNVDSDLLELARLVETGALRPAIAQTFPLEETPEAFRELVSGHARGKLVIRVAE